MSPRKLQVGVAVCVALAVVVLFFIASNPFGMSGMIGTNTSQPQGQLVAQDAIVGSGATAQTGDTITVNYTGRLQTGVVFDSSVGKTPYTFVLGAGNVIPGWDLGLTGMKVGGKRLLVIPSDLAYGPTGYGPIPPNSTLIFEVELVSVEPAGQ
ncbi:FKBP-type peptidyl-prolyl cis-trans isomerase [Acetobacteraceae bacterium]|nr:FKBP-type peptidyl-prolyl cis-trans isomerase [Candidatus Parcubacteria bacterium]